MPTTFDDIVAAGKLRQFLNGPKPKLRNTQKDEKSIEAHSLNETQAQAELQECSINDDCVECQKCRDAHKAKRGL